MYFVDKEKIDGTLAMIDQQVHYLEHMTKQETETEKLALERAVQLLLDGVLDTGTLLIDGYILRDPGSYEDIIDILIDAEVIGDRTGCEIKSLLPIRQQLLQQYLTIDHRQIQQEIDGRLVFFRNYVESVLLYMQAEQSPMTAFGKKDGK